MLSKQVTTNRKIRRDCRFGYFKRQHSTSNRLPPSTDLKTKMSDCLIMYVLNYLVSGLFWELGI